MTRPEHPEQLVDRYLDGDFPPEDAARLSAYVNASAARRGIMAGIRAAVRGTEYGAKPPLDAARAQLLDRIDHELAEEERKEQTRKHSVVNGRAKHDIDRRRQRVWSNQFVARCAGIAVVGTVVAVLGVTYVPTVTSKAADRAPTIQSYTTTPGQRVSVTLTNGTRATLGPATTLRVTGDDVVLAGEAMFVVSHSTATPFTLRAGKSRIRVLGTTFGVRSYPGDSALRVSVAEGKVAVGEDVLVSGDYVTVSPAGLADIRHDAERVVEFLSFSRGVLALDVQPLGEAVVQVSRWLDLDVRVDPRIAHRRLRAVLNDATSTAMLDEIARLTETRYTRSGRTVVFVDR